jgi:T-complex protein 1 subunit zeta
LRVNISAGEGLQDVLKSNLGPLGTIKMYVGVFGIWQWCYRLTAM